MEVEAQGKTFTFPEGTTNAQIGEAVDDYFLNNPVQQQADLPSAQEQALPVGNQPVDFDVGTMVSNIPESGAKAVGDIYNAFRHPVDTGLAINNLGTGLIQKLIPGEQSKEKYADAAGEFIMERYGTMDKFKQSLMDDPVGIVSDIAGLLSGGSLLAPKIGGKMAAIGSAIDPANLVVRGASKAVMNLPAVKNAPKNLYKSAAKFQKKFDQDAVTNTALREGILPTDAGIIKGKEILTGLDSKITDVIMESVNSGKKIPRSKMYKYLKDARKEMGGVNLDAADNLKKLNKVVSDFEKYIKTKGKGQLTAAEVQDFKIKIYETIKWKANQGTGSKAKATTRKAIARAAKDELEIAIPEIKGFNLKMGEVIELMDAIDAPAARIANRDIIGLGLPAKVIAGSVIGDGSGAAIGFLAGIADSPTLKAKLALGLNSIKNQKISAARKRVLAIELIRNAGIAGQEEALTNE